MITAIPDDLGMPGKSGRLTQWDHNRLIFIYGLGEKIPEDCKAHISSPNDDHGAYVVPCRYISAEKFHIVMLPEDLLMIPGRIDILINHLDQTVAAATLSVNPAEKPDDYVYPSVYLDPNETAVAVPGEPQREGMLHMRDIVSGAINDLTDVLSPGSSYTYGELPTIMRQTITGVFESDEVRIEKSMLRGYDGYYSANLPNAEYIGDYAFNSNRRFNILNSPKLKEIGESAFWGCFLYQLNECTAVSIGKTAFAFAFRTDSGSKACNFPNLTSAGDFAFWGSRLTSISLASLEETSASMFNECKSLKTISCPKLKRIASATFCYCSSLTDGSVFSNVESIGANAFMGSGIESFENSVITEVPSGAFKNCMNLKTAACDEALSVKSGAFVGCVALESLSLAKATSIEGDAPFKDCLSLKQTAIPAVQTIEDGMFKGCVSLESVLALSATIIQYNAFEGCTALKEILAPNVTNVWESAFKGCTSLSGFQFSVTMNRIKESAFEGCTSLSEVILPHLSGSVGNRCFANCTNLKYVVVSNIIPSECFLNCVSLTEVDMSEATKLYTVNSTAFNGANNNFTVIVPPTLYRSYYKNSSWSAFKDHLIPAGEEGVDYHRLSVSSNDGTITNSLGPIVVDGENLTATFKPSSQEMVLISATDNGVDVTDQLVMTKNKSVYRFTYTLESIASDHEIVVTFGEETTDTETDTDTGTDTGTEETT